VEQIINKNSTSYRIGYEQGLKGDDAFHCPCKGNPTAEDDHYFGFLAGQAARTGQTYDWRK
jgi:hypothetical protein